MKQTFTFSLHREIRDMLAEIAKEQVLPQSTILEHLICEHCGTSREAILQNEKSFKYHGEILQSHHSATLHEETIEIDPQSAFAQMEEADWKAYANHNTQIQAKGEKPISLEAWQAIRKEKEKEK